MQDDTEDLFPADIASDKLSDVSFMMSAEEADAQEETECVPYLAPPRRSTFAASSYFLSFSSAPSPHASVAIPDNDTLMSEHTESDDYPAAQKDMQWLNSTAASVAVATETEDNKSILQVNLEALFKECASTISSAPTIPVCGYLLRNYLGVSTGQFRSGQQEVVLSILQKRNTLAVFPTGWGKTLCFQFPMLVYRMLFNAELRTWQDNQRSETIETRGKPPCARFGVVVSPLLSLMADQAGRIASGGNLRTAILSSATSASREKTIVDELDSPMCSIDLVFVSPERFVRHTRLRKVLEKHIHRIAFICVDEVHCVSQWAYDFRPSFMYVHRVLDRLGGEGVTGDKKKNLPPFLCLTATAKPSVINDLKVIFRIERTVMAPYSRDNLRLESISLVDTGSQKPPTQRMIQEKLLQAVLELPKPMLVYVQTRLDAEELTTFLTSKLGAAQSEKQAGGQNSTSSSSTIFTSATHVQLRQNSFLGNVEGNRITIRRYHAALERHVRTRTQQQFMQGSIDVLIATVAFGMGIDKSNIRSVVHASSPGSIESYVQETGRAGRDGEKSVCRLLYNPFDFYTLRSRALVSYLSPSEILSIVEHILGSPTTHIGDKVTLVSVSRISEELVISEETVETVLFMLLSQEGGVLRELVGTTPIGYRVNHTAAEVVLTSNHTTRRKRGRDAIASSGVSGVLAQLDVIDDVFELCRQSKRIENIVTAANTLSLSLRDFQFRLNDLVAGGFISVRQLAPAYVISLGDQFLEAAMPVTQKLVAERLWHTQHMRFEAMMKALEVTFSVLQNPTHDLVRWGLEWDEKKGSRVAGHVGIWQQPPRNLTKVKAVSIANDFVEKNRPRICSTYEAARALLGVLPKPLTSRGKYASELPLSVNWYVGSPYFGLLKEFDLQWLLKVLAPHRLDEEESTGTNSRLPTT